MTEIHGIALMITIISEAIVMFIYTVINKHRRKIRYMISVVVITTITHTIFWYTLPIINIEYIIKLYAFEIIIVITEGFLYSLIHNERIYKMIILSFIMNGVSFYLGIYIWELI